MFGPWGAAIGGVIGGGVALMDKGVRDAVFKSIGQFATNIANTTKKLWDGVSSLVQTLFKFFTADLPGILLNGLKSLYIDIPLKLLAFSAELGKSMIESVSKFDLGQALRNTWEGIKGAVTGSQPARKAGGNVYPGETYRVNESGKEFFSPTAIGTITNNATLNNLSSRASSPPPATAMFNITIQVNGNMGVGDVEALRGPVLRIVEEAWASATQGTISRGAVG